MLFADDTIIYAKALSHEVEKISMILQDYEQASSQSIYLLKSSISFNPNTSTVVRNNIITILHIKHLKTPDKFLGLPSF